MLQFTQDEQKVAELRCLWRTHVRYGSLGKNNEYDLDYKSQTLKDHVLHWSKSTKDPEISLSSFYPFHWLIYSSKKWEQECGTVLLLSRPNQAHFHYQHFTDWDAIHNPIRFDMTMNDNAFYSSFETPTNPVSFSPSPNTDAHFAPREKTDSRYWVWCQLNRDILS